MLRWRAPNQEELGVMRSAARRTLLNSAIGQAAMVAVGLEDVQAEPVNQLDDDEDDDMKFLGGAWAGLRRGNIDGPKSAMRRGGKAKKSKPKAAARRGSVTFGSVEEVVTSQAEDSHASRTNAGESSSSSPHGDAGASPVVAPNSENAGM